MPAASRLFPVLGLLLVLTACGGGGSDPDPITVALGTEAARDGWAAPGGYFVANAPDGVIVGTGDHVMGTQARRQFFSFDLSSLPAGWVVQAATLRLYQSAVSGTPYTTHGVVIVDHMDYGTLDGGDYDAAALSSNVGTLSSDAGLGWKSLDVTALVAADAAAARTRTQVRVRWSVTDNDGDPTDDEARFVDAEDLLGTGYPGELVVSYVVP